MSCQYLYLMYASINHSSSSVLLQEQILSFLSSFFKNSLQQSAFVQIYLEIEFFEGMIIRRFIFRCSKLIFNKFYSKALQGILGCPQGGGGWFIEYPEVSQGMSLVPRDPSLSVSVFYRLIIQNESGRRSPAKNFLRL